MEINELKERISTLKTNKAILENERRKILKTLKGKYKIETVAEAKKAIPKVSTRLNANKTKKEEMLQEAETLLNEFEDEEEEED